MAFSSTTASTRRTCANRDGDRRQQPDPAVDRESRAVPRSASSTRPPELVVHRTPAYGCGYCARGNRQRAVEASCVRTHLMCSSARMSCGPNSSNSRAWLADKASSTPIPFWVTERTMRRRSRGSSHARTRPSATERSANSTTLFWRRPRRSARKLMVATRPSGMPAICNKSWCWRGCRRMVLRNLLAELQKAAKLIPELRQRLQQDGLRGWVVVRFDA